MEFQLGKKGGLILALALAFFFAAGAAQTQASPYSKYAGTTIVINWPAHAFYDAATKLIPEFTKETGIKVEVDKVEYMRMRDKQLLEMSKPKGDYDLISYVCMWKTEYVAKGLLAPLAPFFTNPALADSRPTMPRTWSPPIWQRRGWQEGRKVTCPARPPPLSTRFPSVRDQHLCLSQGYF